MNHFNHIALTICLLSPSALYADQGDTDALRPSGTLPVVYINTENSAPIVSKEDYLNAKIFIDPAGHEDVAGLGSEEDPVDLEIRGRGNSSWGFDKKPYKLKLGKKASPFGWEKSKHYVLLAHAPTQMYMREAVCFELARYIDMGWVPRNYPVEVVLNGEYLGVYDFSENVRIDSGRVDINEQPDENTDPDTIDDGWLVEIDNTIDTPQISVPQCFEETEVDPVTALFTMKTPEVLSDLQTDWITDQMTTITRAVYNPDKTDISWANLLDVETLAKYYIIQELTCNYDAYVGSTYLYHAKDGKWMSGPMWDSGWSFVEGERSGTFAQQRITLQNDPGRHVWILELWKSPYFRQCVIDEWRKFYPAKFEPIKEFAEHFYSLTKDAYAVNAKKWPQYDGINIDATYSMLRHQLENYPQWMEEYITSWSAVDEIAIDATFRLSPDGTITISGTSGLNAALHNIQGIAAASATLDASGNTTLRIPSRGIWILTLTDPRGGRTSHKIAF